MVIKGGIIMNYVKLNEERKRLIKELKNFTEMRQGYLNERMNICGKPNCKCKDKKNPQLHGPYYFITTKENGKTKCGYIKDKEKVPAIKNQLAAYKRFKEWSKNYILICEKIADSKLEKISTSKQGGKK
jgi:hypothetical protein